MSITVDARMLRHSGIGTYLQALLPAVVARYAGEPMFGLIANGNQNEPMLEGLHTTRFLSPIYAPTEQFEYWWRVSSKGNLLWIPHFNAPLCWRGKLVVTVHDLFHFACADLAGGAHKVAYAQLLLKQACRNADAILCVSRFTAAELCKYTAVDPGKIHVIPNGVDRDWFGIERKASPVPYPYFLYVGNVKPHKNLARLIQAYQQIAADVPQHLVIVGQTHGFSTGDNETLRLAQSMPDRIHLAGLVEQAMLHQYVAHADALVFPSLYEGFGLPPLEAMACGCPVLASNAASIPEVCADAVLYFDPLKTESMVQAMLRLSRDPVLRAELSRRGPERARQFDWSVAAARTLAVIDAVQKSTVQGGQ